MIIKALILTTLLTHDPVMIASIPPVRTEARKRGKHNKGRRRGGRGLR